MSHNHKRDKAKFRRKPSLESVDARVLYSTDPVVGELLLSESITETTNTQVIEAPATPEHTTIDDDTTSLSLDDLEAELNQLEQSSSASNNKSALIVINNDVADYQNFIDNLNLDESTDYEVILLDSSENGFNQLIDKTNNLSAFDSIHLLGHGADGSFNLGSSYITQNNIDNYQSELNSLGELLTVDGDLLLYGCYIAKSDTGETFIESLASYTHADIAASNDATGSAAQGGDWDLEIAQGSIESNGLSSTWDNLLAYTNSGQWNYISTDLNNTTVEGVVVTITNSGAVEHINNTGTFSGLASDYFNDPTGSENIKLEIDDRSFPTSGTISISFSETVINPVIHIGAFGNGNNNALLSLTSSGEIVKLAGVTRFTVNETTNQVYWNGDGSNHSGSGSIVIIGEFDSSTTIDFDVSLMGSNSNDVFTLGLALNPQLVVSAPATANTDENTALIFSSGNGNQITLSESNPDSVVETSLSVSNGTLTLASTTGITISDGANGSASLSISGSISDVEAALNGLSYLPDTDYSGSDTLTINDYDSSIAVINNDADLLAHYEFNDASSLTEDNSNNSNTLTNSGAAFTSSTEREGEATFTAGDYLETTGTFGNPANVTLATWVNVTGVDTTGAHIISLGDNIALEVSSSGHVGAFYYNTAASDWLGVTYSGANIINDGWHHIAFTFDDTNNTLTLYLDGVIVDTDNTSNSINYVHGSDTTIGVHGNGGIDWDLTGLVDDARIYGRALTPEEITYLVSDKSFVSTSTVSIYVNAAPDITAIETSALNYTENSSAIAITSTLALNDLDTATLSFATVQISGNYEAGQDYLSFTNTGSITGSWNSTTATLTLSGIDSTANYQAALRNITFFNTSNDASALTRTLIFTANDGSATSVSATRNITITAVSDAPTFSASGTNPSYLEASAATALFSGSNADAIESAELFTQITLSITGIKDGSNEKLIIDGTTISLSEGSQSSAGNTTNGFSWSLSLSSGSGTLTINHAGASQAQINALINGLNYEHSDGSNPSDGNRVFTLATLTDSGSTANGGQVQWSGSIASTVNVNPVNQAPSGSDNTITTLEDTTYYFQLSDFGFSDSDSDNLRHIIIDTISLPAGADLSIISIGQVTVGMQISENSISGSFFRFIPGTDNNGSGIANFTFRIIDDGGTANGGNNTESIAHTLTIDVTPVNDAPIIGGINSGAVTEDVSVSSGDISTSGALTISDVDTGEAVFQAATISGSYGDLTLDTAGNWSYSADNSQIAIQQINSSQSITDTLTVLTADGTNHNITITINGAADASIITGTIAGTLAEDGTSVATGTLTITDADSSDSPTIADVATTASVGGYGTISLSSGTWTYTLNNSHAAVQALDITESLIDTYSFTASDGSVQLVTLTINGAEDIAVVSGSVAGAVTEDSALITTGSISISDTDTNDSPVFADAPIYYQGGSYGSMILTSGTWTYTLNNNHVAVKVLDLGDTLTDTYTFTATDGTTQDITLTIHGAEDAAIISGTTSGTLAEEGVSTANGSITISDTDGDDNPVFADVATTASSGGYGTINLSSGTWTYLLNNSHASVQALDINETLIDTYTFIASDGSIQVITLTIDGAEDAPTLSNAIADQNATEDSAFSFTTAANAFSDIDSSDNPLAFTATLSDGVTALPSWLTITDNGNGTATFSGTPLNADVGTLSLQIQATDGTTIATDIFDIVIANTNDAATIGGTNTGAVTEDIAVSTGNITTSGSLTISDPDVGESIFQAATIPSTYGVLTIDTAGNWSYSADNSQAAIQQLGSGESLIDSFTVLSADNTMRTIFITINGSDDLAVVSGTTVGTIAEDGTLIATGALSIADTDTSDTPTFSDVATTTSIGGYGTIELTSGTWTYTLNNSHAAIQALDSGETLTDTFIFTASDGITQTITLTINGAEDIAVVSGTTAGTIAEDGTLIATGTITIADTDTSDTPTFADVATTTSIGGYGTMELTAGSWIYTLNNSHAAVQALDTSETLTDTYTFTASDGITQTITLTINGAEDIAVVSGTTTGIIAEDGSLIATGAITIADTDTSDTPTFADVATTTSIGGYGTMELTAGTWTYTLNNSHAAVQALDIGETLTDTFIFTASDGITQTITLTINGAEDAPTLSNAIADQSATEDSAFSFTTAANTFNDIDSSDNPLAFTATLSDGVTALPSWLTITDNGNGTATFSGTPINSDVGTLSLQIQATDGTTIATDIFDIVIANTNDAATIGGTNTGAVTEDIAVSAGDITTSGSLTISDPDVGESIFQAATITSSYGALTIDTAGNWSYSADNSQAIIQQLGSGESLTDSFTVLSADSTMRTIFITINGNDDLAVVSGTTTGIIAEDGSLIATGAITIADTDTSDTPTFADVATTTSIGGYGTMELTAGTWTYTLNNSHAAVQALDIGETLTDTFIFTASDGITQTITLTINGAEDAPTLSNAIADQSATEDSAFSFTTAANAFSDIDSSDNPLAFTATLSDGVTALPSWLTITDNSDGTATFSGTPLNADVGTLSLQIQATDGTTIATDIFDIVIANTNDAATIGGTNTGAVTEDIAVSAGDITTSGSLTISDPDVGESIFQAATITSSYGALTIDTAGNWNYSADNSQATIQQLGSGESLTDSFTVLSADSTMRTIFITINGTNDLAVISGTTAGTIAEDSTLIATGTITIADTDTSDTPNFANVASTTSIGGYGTMELTSGTWTYTLNNSHTAVQALDTGETLTDTYTFTASDGITQTITLTINGAEDAPTLSNAIADQSATEDSAFSFTTAANAFSDIDSSDNPLAFTATLSDGVTALPSWLTITDNSDGTATFSGTPLNADVGTLSLQIQATDGTTIATDIFDIVIANTNDAATIGGTNTGAVTEDIAVSAGDITTSGSLTISDPDVGESIFQAATITSSYGALTIDTAGNWNYSADNSQAIIQQLGSGESLTDSFTVLSADSTMRTIFITINGTNDLAVVSGTTVGTIAEDGTLIATGALSIADTDTSDTPTFSDVATTTSIGGYGTIELTSGTWTYTLNNSHAAIQALDSGETLTDTFIFTASDGITQTITLTINGAEDIAVVSGTTAGTIAEDGTLIATGAITIADTDTSDTPNFADIATTTSIGGYGTIELTAGTWTYTLNNSHAAVQALDTGETLTDTYTFTASDGITQTIALTINGAEDAPTLSNAIADQSATEDSAFSFTTAANTFNDIDSSDNPLAFTATLSDGVTALPIWLTITDNGNGTATFSGTPLNADAGTLSLQIQATDGTTTATDNFDIVIANTNDAPTIGGSNTGIVTEDTSVSAGDITTSASLTISDPDVGESVFQAATINGTYGDLIIDAAGNWSYSADNSQAAIQQLANLETLTDTLTVLTADGTNHNIVITLNGADDASIITATTTGSIAEDGVLVATGSLSISDTDSSDTPTFTNITTAASSNGYGTISLSSNTWSYALNNSHTAVQALDAGQTLSDSFTFTASDGNTQLITLTINGAEDIAVISGTTTGSVTEDSALTDSGSLTILDIDTNDTPSFADVASTTSDNGYGAITLNSGTWTYTLNNSHAAVQALDTGETLSDSFTFTATDGITQVVSFTINGSEDAPQVSNAIADQSATEDAVFNFTTAANAFTDVDSNDNPLSFTATLADGFTALPSWLSFIDNGNGTVTFSGTPLNADVGTLGIQLKASDGNSTVTDNFNIVIANTNDAPTIAGSSAGAVTEDISVSSGDISASGSLTISDPDIGESVFQATTLTGSYGDLSIDTAGNWNYAADNSQAAIQQLGNLETLSETFTVLSADGTSQNIGITLNGTDDISVISGTIVGTVAEDGALSTTGALTITDTDSSDTPTFADVASTASNNNYGTIDLISGTWTYTLNNSHTAVQALDVGETLNDTYTFTASDGNTQLITLTINGAEDAPIVSNIVPDQSATEDSVFSFTTAANTFSDVDSNDNPLAFSATLADGITALPGWLTITDNGNGTATFSGTPSNADVGTLSIQLKATDGSTTVNDIFNIVIANTNDAPTIAGVDSGAVTEDLSVSSGNITTSASLTISDPDVGESVFQAATINGSYGDLSIDTAGNWIYSADNSQAAIQQLENLETLSDTLTVLTADGTSHNIVITLNGSDDAAVVTGTITGAVTEDGTLIAGGGLSITDTDTSDTPTFADVASTASNSGYGTISLSAGTWSYTLNNSHTAVQALDSGETLNDTFTFTASDGTTQLVTLTINGAEDIALVAGTIAGNLSEDGTLTANGIISINDTDTSDTPSFADVSSTTSNNGYGTINLSSGTWSYTLNNSHAAVQALDVSETLTDTFTFTASDGITQLITLTINGAEDIAVVSGTVVGSTAEDGILITSGTIAIADTDTSDTPSFSDVATITSDNNYGTIDLISGTWTYTLNNSHSVVQALDVGETLSDTYTFTASDGVTQLITITINGAEDIAVITGTATGITTEDGALIATGTLSISDTDTNDTPTLADVATTTSDNNYGTIDLISGTWTYTLNNSHAAVQALDSGDTLTDSYTFTASDGISQLVTITINGTEDIAVVSGTVTGSTAEDGSLIATGLISISDTDTSDTPSFADVASTASDNNYGTINLVSGTWTYTLNNSHTAIQALDTGETLTDTYTFTASDGITQLITLTINGAEDIAVVSGAITGTTAEDGSLIASGAISIADTDTSDSPTFVDVASTASDNNYGTIDLISGTWTYTLNNSHAAVQALDVTETLSDSYTFTASDGISQLITLTINGAEDIAVVTGAITGTTAEEGNLIATGLISIADTDTSDTPTFSDVAITASDNNYGTINLISGTWTYTLNNSHITVQALDVGETLTDTYTFTATDGISQLITLTINGAEDIAVVSGTTTGAIAEEGILIATGAISIADTDTSDSPTFADVASTASDNNYGTIDLISGTWTYTLNNSHAAVQALDVGETLTDTYTFTASDGITQLITFTINGAEDIAVVTGTITGTTAEDGSLTATGTIAIADTDTSDTPSFADVTSTASDNHYGTIDLTSGTWIYTLNNSHAAVQALDVGETLTDTYTFTATDGTTQLVTLTINGAEDIAVVTGTIAATTAEDGSLIATGAINIADTDTSDTPSFADVATTASDNNYGTINLISGTWTYTLNNSHTAVQALDTGETLTDTYTFTASDGITQLITLTINGAEDIAVVTGTIAATTAEDGSLIATGLISIADTDTSDTPNFADVATTASDNNYGTINLISGTWTYTLNNSHTAVQSLDTGETLTDTYTFTATDGTTQLVTLTINGAEDIAVVTGTITGSTAEDGNLITTGLISIADTDTSDTPTFSDIATTASDNNYGTIDLISGTWTYTLNNSHSAVQALDVGEILSDSYTFIASDGITQLITLTINGAEDIAIVTGTVTGSTAEDGNLIATGLISIADTDTSDSPSFADVATTASDNNYGTINLISGTWIYTLNNSHSAVQALDVGETLSDSYTFTASDGISQLITFTINGNEDIAIVTGTSTGAVTEDGTLLATGTLTITDTDNNDSPSFADVASTLSQQGYGNMSMTAGIWSYTLNNSHSAVQALDAGETLSDSFTFTASDGISQTVTLTITGSEDASVITGSSTSSVTEDVTLTATGSLSINDTDTSDSPVFAYVTSTATDNSYGSISLTAGNWLYHLNNTHAAIQALDTGETLSDSFTFTASDGNSQVVTLTIHGSEDIAVITGISSGAVTEDATLSTSGSLAINDTDSSDTPTFTDVAITTSDSGYGNISMTAGTWLYTLNNQHAAVQALDVAETLSDTFTFTATDGSSQQVTLTITGSEDAAVISGSSSGSVAEDGLLNIHGALSIDDTDSSDSPVFVDVANTSSDESYGTVTLIAGVWSYSLDNDHPAVQALDSGETLTDSFTFTASDGSAQPITITLHGAEDIAIIEGITTGNVTENTQLSSSGQLSISDTDTSDVPQFLDIETATSDNSFGAISMTAGSWTYLLNPNDAAIEALDQGEQLTDSYTFIATDSSQQTITITIDGTEDLPLSSDQNITILEDQRYVLSSNDITFSDVDGDTFHGIMITTLPSNGELRLNNIVVESGAFISKAMLDNGQLVYIADDNDSGNNYGNFSYAVYDGTTFSQADYVFAIDVTPIDDAPLVYTPFNNLDHIPGQAITLLSANGEGLTLIDHDDENGYQRVVISVAEGNLAIDTDHALDSVTGLNSQQLILTGSSQAINEALQSLSYLPKLGASGNIEFTIIATDVLSNSFERTGLSTTSTVSIHLPDVGFGIPTEDEGSPSINDTDEFTFDTSVISNSAYQANVRQLSNQPFDWRNSLVKSEFNQLLNFDDNNVQNQRIDLFPIELDDLNSNAWDIDHNALPEIHHSLFQHIISDFSNDDALYSVDLSMLETLNDYSLITEGEHIWTVPALKFGGTAITLGTIFWMLRGGSLLTSFLLMYPAWRDIDPLPVLGTDNDDAH